MKDRIVVDFAALSRISRELDEAGIQLQDAANMLSFASLSRDAGSELRVISSASLKTVGGTLNAGSVSQAVHSFQTALRKVSIYSKSLSTSVKQTSGKFQIAEGAISGNGPTSFLISDGIEYSRTGFFPTVTISEYVLKRITDHSEEFLLKTTTEDKTELSGDYKAKDLNKGIKDRLKKKGLYRENKDGTDYYNTKTGQLINKKDAPEFYDRQATLLELKREASYSTSIFDGTYNLSDNDKITLKVSEFATTAGISGGLYVIGADGQRKFSPGVKAECGASYTIFEVSGEHQLLGDENLGLSAGWTATAGKAEASAEGVFQVFDSNGNFDFQADAGFKAEAIAGELEGEFTGNVLGGGVTGKASVNFGVGVHGDVGYRDGVFKLDFGASAGVGVSVDVEVDVGSMVNTVVDSCTAAWSGIQDGWNQILNNSW